MGELTFSLFRVEQIKSGMKETSGETKDSGVEGCTHELRLKSDDVGRPPHGRHGGDSGRGVDGAAILHPVVALVVAAVGGVTSVVVVLHPQVHFPVKLGSLSPG